MNILTFTLLQASAPAGAGQPQGAGGGAFWIMIIAMFVIMWLFMIRPQRKQQKELEKFRNSLKRGDKVVTAGGIYGTDGCASSNNLDMLETMKTTALFQKAWRKDPSALPLQTLMDMATVNGAKALGLKTGKIEEGYEADIQIVDTDNTFFLSPGPFLANFIYSAHSDCVTSLISGGKFVMRDRNVFGEKMILKGARTVLNEINYKQ